MYFIPYSSRQPQMEGKIAVLERKTLRKESATDADVSLLDY